MGRWGMSLFEGDDDLDLAIEISEDASTELYCFELDDKNPDMGGKGLEGTRAHLNNGVLDKLFDKYSTKAKGKDFRLALTAALAMRVGATISPKHMTMLRAMFGKKAKAKLVVDTTAAGSFQTWKNRWRTRLHTTRTTARPGTSTLWAYLRPCTIWENLLLSRAARAQVATSLRNSWLMERS